MPKFPPRWKMLSDLQSLQSLESSTRWTDQHALYCTSAADWYICHVGLIRKLWWTILFQCALIKHVTDISIGRTRTWEETFTSKRPIPQKKTFWGRCFPLLSFTAIHTAFVFKFRFNFSWSWFPLLLSWSRVSADSRLRHFKLWSNGST